MSFLILETVPGYSQFKTYYPGDRAVYNGICYECLAENSWDFGFIRMPLVNVWLEKDVEPCNLSSMPYGM